MDQVPSAPKAPGAPSAPAPQGGGAAGLVTEIHDGLLKLMDMVQKTGAIPPEEKQQLGSIITQYQGFVDGLGQPAGGAPKPQGPVPAPGSAPMEAGANPNARPL